MARPALVLRLIDSLHVWTVKEHVGADQPPRRPAMPEKNAGAEQDRDERQSCVMVDGRRSPAEASCEGGWSPCSGNAHLSWRVLCARKCQSPTPSVGEPGVRGDRNMKSSPFLRQVVGAGFLAENPWNFSAESPSPLPPALDFQRTCRPGPGTRRLSMTHPFRPATAGHPAPPQAPPQAGRNAAYFADLAGQE
jgi:hypothetical protein